MARRTTKAQTDADADAPKRLNELLDSAGQLIATQGYDGTSMRDIAREFGILPGSIYHYFPSKEALFLAIHTRVVDGMIERLEAAVAKSDDPWQRLRHVLHAHISGLLGSGALLRIISPDQMRTPAMADRIRSERRSYETRFAKVIEVLELDPQIDPRLLRLNLLGALNWVPVWHKPGGRYSVDDIVDQMVLTLRKLSV
ncbi:MAG: TetR/AcrR family transcriptional regulator [Rhodobacterales bacterium]|uniref:TetR/AcrR family transcriptional regulator n=1 Tax=Gemmobacter nectariphilus TaxID=220343 RepID=UPI0004143FD5|nr:TetR/AcrR family transcriptional regulator [Gemmobacter nectariphilus]MDX5356298.1 TetR/AcrR family transcriptional regulator [Rhodobacterales bacterium]MDX5498525.1 TetR/AcrR family transcriptional regulator [Rhodobacterales bacterium]